MLLQIVTLPIRIKDLLGELKLELVEIDERIAEILKEQKA